jgi:putative ABC transport system permease protein
VIEPRWRKVLRDLWLHRGRLMLVVPAIAVGLIAAGSVLDAWALVERATRLGFAASNPASATILTDSVDTALLTRIRALPEIAEAEGRRTVRAAIRTPAITATAELFTADDLTGIGIGRVASTAGAWPPGDGGVAIERSSVDFAGVALGDRVSVSIGDAEPVALDVTGVARDVSLAPGWMEHVVYGFVTRSTMARLGVSATLDEVRVVVRDRSLDQAAVRKVASRVREVVEATGRRVRDVNVPVPGEHIHSAQMNSLLFTQGAFGVLALLLGALLVVNLISAMLVGQVREIGVMKTIGARPGQLAAMYLGLASALGVAATAVALPVAGLIGRGYGAFKGELLNFPVEGYTVPGWVMAVEAAVGLLLPVLAAAAPVRRGARLTVGEALRDVGIGGGSPGAIMTRIRGPARPLLFSLRNAFRRPQRLAFTLVTLATGGAIFLAARNLETSIGRGMDAVFAPLRYDLSVRLAEPHRPDSIEATLARVAGVGRVEAWTGAQAEVRAADGAFGNAFLVAGPPAGTRLLRIPISAGRWLDPADGRALVISERLARVEGLAAGDSVTLRLGGRIERWRVVGIGGVGLFTAGAYAPRRVVAGDATNGRATSAVVSAAVAGDAARLELIQRVRAELGRVGFEAASTSLVVEARSVVEDHLLTVADFLGVMAWVIVAVGGLGLASTMSLAVLERTREIGVLRAIGARHRSILAIVVAEALVIGILSWLVALPLAAPMSAVLAAVFGRTMFAVPVTWMPDPTGIMLWLGLVVLLSAGAAAGPAWRATRVSTAAALAYE